MIIRTMKASFGRLNQAKLEMGPGLNVISGPNEGGKSTWCAFLRSMLYGINTRERDKQNYLAEKNRYQPWSGAPMEGELVLDWQGRTVTVRRFARGATPFAAFSATDAATGEPIPGLTADALGELLTGVGREAFERTAFVGQGNVTVTHSGELESRISALVSSGEETVSYSQVERRLKDWQNRRRHNKTGLIPQLEGELAGLDERLAQMDESRLRVEGLEEELTACKARRADLQSLREDWEALEGRERYDRYQTAWEQLEEARRRVAELEEEPLPDEVALRRAQDDLAYLRTLEDQIRQAERDLTEASALAETAEQAAADPLFVGLDPDRAWQEAQRDLAKTGEKPARGGGIALLVLGLLAAAGVAGAWYVKQLIPLNGMYGGVAAGLAAALLGAVLILRANRACAAARQSVLERYGAAVPEEIPARAEDYRTRCTAAAEARNRAELVARNLQNLRSRREGLQLSLLAFTHSFAPEVKDLFGISAAISRSLSRRELLTTARVRMDGAQKLVDSLTRDGVPRMPERTVTQPPAMGREQVLAALAAAEGEEHRLHRALAAETGHQNTLGDRTVLTARREQAGEELRRRREEYDAIALALEGLNRADDALRSRFSPEINRRAGEILSALTGGKYDHVSLTRTFEAMAGGEGELLPHRAITLSQGTADQLYLAVRLAVCDLVLPAEEGVPLVLDDALAAFDDERMALALDFLHRLSEHRQILLFTCHRREMAYLAGRPGVTGIDLH